MINLSEQQEEQGWAYYLPAISGFYTGMMNKLTNEPDYFSDDRIPDKFKNPEAFNFLNATDGIYNYKTALYSAGHAQFDLTKADVKEAMVQKRDRHDTIIVGDSGGYQVATGVIKLNWDTVMTPAADPLREKVLRWLEHTADWSMTFDVPAVAAEPPMNKKTGLKKFEDTLAVSVYNLHYFMEHRKPGATKFLNVLSGTSVKNSKKWYDEVKDFSKPDKVQEMGYSADRTLEGFAFAGINTCNMTAVLERFVDLLEDNLIEGKDWVHVLGLGRTDWACFLTSIQRQMRKHYNPNITISFDAASPFLSTAMGLVYNYNNFTSKRWGFSMDKFFDNRKLKGSELNMPFISPVMTDLKLKDFCVMGDDHAVMGGERRFDITKEEYEALKESGIDITWNEADLSKQGKVTKTSWDTYTYLMIMCHNVYKHIEAVQEANRLYDIELARLKPSYKDWTREKRASEASVISPHIPSAILCFDSFAEELFDPNKTASERRSIIRDNKKYLDSISFGKSANDVFNDLFQVEGAVKDIENNLAVDTAGILNDIQGKIDE